MGSLTGKILYEIFTFGLEKFGRYYSSYRATVYDNDDKDGYNRIQLIVPKFDKTTPYAAWAWPKGNFSGKDYGMNLLPQKGDLVWVEFEHGDSNHPIWSHGYFTKGEKPKEFNAPDTFGFKTPYGFSVILNDQGKTLTITTPKNQVIELNASNETVVIKNQTGNLIQLSKNNLLVDAGGNSIVTLKDGNINLGKSISSPIALGNNTEESLNTIIGIVEDTIKAHIQQLTLDTPAVAVIGATGGTALITKLTQYLVNIQQAKLEVPKLKSKTVNSQ